MTLLGASLAYVPVSQAQPAATSRVTGMEPVTMDLRGLAPDKASLIQGKLGAPAGSSVLTVAPDFARDGLLSLRDTGKLTGDDLSAITVHPGPARQTSRSWTERVVDPAAGANAIQKYAQNLTADCPYEGTPTAVATCKTNARGAGAVAVALRTASQQNPGCSQAAQAYLPYYTSATIPPAAADFDAKCLSGFGGLSPQAAAAAGGLPVALTTGGDNGVAKGAMSAVALLKISSDSLPWCGGLLIAGNRFLTAKHCLDDAPGGPKAGLTVWAIDGRGHWQAQLDPMQEGPSDLVGDDWAILKLQSDQPIVVPKEIFDPPGPEEEALVVAFFRHAVLPTGSSTGGAIGALQANWQQGIRWPKAGLCHVFRDGRDCIRSVCEAIPGFSGAPMFATTAQPNAPLHILGLVSRDEQGVSTSCGVRDGVSMLVVPVTPVAAQFAMAGA